MDLDSDGVYSGGRNAAGQYEGWGSMSWPDGSSYEGNFKNGKFEGNGSMIWADNDTYEGQFVAGKKEGHGTYRWADGDVYTGMWSAGSRMGAGTFSYSDGRIELGRYRGDSDVGDVVMWSADRRQAWRMLNGEAEQINPELAYALGHNLAVHLAAPSSGSIMTDFAPKEAKFEFGVNADGAHGKMLA